MKDLHDLNQGQVYYLPQEMDHFGDYDCSKKPIGKLAIYTKVKLTVEDFPECHFEVMNGEFQGDHFMWSFENGCATASDLLTEAEYQQVINPVSEQDIAVKISNFKTLLTEHQLRLFEEIVVLLEWR